jgi:hypothetical protein
VAFAGGAFIVGPNWDALGVVGQTALGVAIAAIGLVIGTWLVRQAEAGAVRLGTFLWLVATGGVALSTAAVMVEIDPSEEGWIPFMIGLPVIAIGTALWRNLDRPLQLLTAVAGLILIGTGIAIVIDVSMWAASPVVWGASVLFGILAAIGRLHPRLPALVIASAGAMLGSFMLGEESERLAAVAAVATASVIVAYALQQRCWPLVGVGLFAFFIAMTSLMQTVLEGMAARLIAVIFGLAVVTAVAVRAQKAASRGPHPSSG